ncbi:MAG: hypothetical protein KDG44_08665 [Burkholderiaceae bacterium]|nr:hypothetical protein [Burkholderiaceae bacterium]
MGKIDRSEKFKSYDTMLPQGARSRFQKAVDAMEAADKLVPDEALDGNPADIRQAIKHLYSAAENLAELLAYRKMYGVD